MTPKTATLFRSLLCIGIALVFGCGTKNEGEPGQAAFIEEIDPGTALELVRENEGNADFVILDIRRPKELAAGWIEGSVNLDFHSPTFEDELRALDQGRTYLVYCSTGNRSVQAAPTMEALGFVEVYLLAGGIVAWQEAGFPTVTE